MSVDCGHKSRIDAASEALMPAATSSTGTANQARREPNFYLVSFDIEVIDKDSPRACWVVARFHHKDAEYWLVRIEPDFGTFDGSQSEYVGDYGQHVPTSYFAVAPRLVGIGFDKVGMQPVHVHVLVPKGNRYPPSETKFALDDYVHLFWGAIYPTRALALRRPIKFLPID